MYYDPKTKKRVFPESKLSTPQEWEQEIRRVEKDIGNPSGWTMDSYNMLQDKLNEYKVWREKHPEVVDHSNKLNEYVVPLPPHLNADEVTEVELTDKEADKYRAGGYVLEEMQKGGADNDDKKKQALLKQQKIRNSVKEEAEAFNRKQAAGENLISKLNLIKNRIDNNKPTLDSFNTRYDKMFQSMNPLTFDLRPDDVKENERLAGAAATKEIEDFYKKKELLKQEEIKKAVQVLKETDWKGIGNNMLNMASKTLQPLASSVYDVGSSISNIFENYNKTLELNDKEVNELKAQGYIVEEVTEKDSVPATLTDVKSTSMQKLKDPELKGSDVTTTLDNQVEKNNYTFDNWLSDKQERYAKAQQNKQDVFKPIMANHPANAFRNQPDKGGVSYTGPITPVENVLDEVGKYADALVGLPKKIYKGVNKSISDKVSDLNKFVSDEFSDLKDKWDKTSILPANVAKPVDYVKKFGVIDGGIEYLISENSKYPITNTTEQNNLMLNNEKLNKDLQNLNYKLTDPDLSDAEKLEYQKQFNQIISQKEANAININKIRAEQTGPFDMWFNLFVPSLLNQNNLLKAVGDVIGKDFSKAGTDLKQIANKTGIVDKLEISESINPKFETYSEKLERETDHYLEDKRFDDLDVSKKDWYRWKFRASASNKDPFMVSIYGTKGERNTNPPDILGQGALFHFLDQSPLTGYQHSLTKNFIKEMKPTDYIGVLEKSKDADNVYALKYKQLKDHKANSKNSFYIRTNKFDDINFEDKAVDYNFVNHKYWTLKSTGENAIPISIAPDPNLYDASSGQSVVFIFKHIPKSGKEQQRYIHFAGSPNEIKNQGFEIKQAYGLKDDELIIGVADAGSYSAAVRSKNGKVTNSLLNTSNSGYWNPSKNTGAGAVLLE